MAGLAVACSQATLIGGDGTSGIDDIPALAGGTGAGASASAGGGSAVAAGGGLSAAGGVIVESACAHETTYVGRAPIRRLTRFEFNQTVRALLDDTTDPGNSLPPELQGSGFGNDADAQPVSSFLAEQYGIIAEAAALKAVNTPSVMERYAPCYATVDEGNEANCSRTFIENFAKETYRRPLEPSELEELLSLLGEMRESLDLKESLGSLIEAILQSPDFLYRVELGDPKTAQGTRIRPTGHEMASRLSYFFWGGPPDEALERAATNGELVQAEGILGQARRLLEDPRARPVIRFFFSRFLPIEGLTDLARDTTTYPTFSPQIGALMRQETDTFLEYEIFEGPGDWKSILTSPYTFVNQQLASFYGIPGVTGTEFQKVNVDPAKRLGLLTQGSILTGTTVSNFTNPVRRGIFLLRNMMCVELPEPPPALAASIVPPKPEAAKTGRQRYSAHSEVGVCAECHTVMDPPGFALENYDAVGLWRDEENGEPIDPSGSLEILPEPFGGPLELVRLVAESPRTHACFAERWLTFASGRTLDEGDKCLAEKLEHKFAESGYSVKDLLLEITQTDAFQYMPSKEAE